MTDDEIRELVKKLRTYSKDWRRITHFAPEHWHGQAMEEAADIIEKKVLKE